MRSNEVKKEKALAANRHTGDWKYSHLSESWEREGMIAFDLAAMDLVPAMADEIADLRRRLARALGELRYMDWKLETSEILFSERAELKAKRAKRVGR